MSTFYTELNTSGHTPSLPVTIFDAKGDLLVGTAADAAARLAVGANNQVLVADSAQAAGVKWAAPPSAELAYAEVTADTAINATVDASANTIVTAAAVTFDGATPVILEFYAPFGTTPAASAAELRILLFEDGTFRCLLAYLLNPGTTAMAVPLHPRFRFTPSAASHTYSIRGRVNAGAGTVSAGSGSGGARVPVFIRIARA